MKRPGTGVELGRGELVLREEIAKAPHGNVAPHEPVGEKYGPKNVEGARRSDSTLTITMQADAGISRGTASPCGNRRPDQNSSSAKRRQS